MNINVGDPTEAYFRIITMICGRSVIFWLFIVVNVFEIVLKYIELIEYCLNSIIICFIFFTAKIAMRASAQHRSGAIGCNCNTRFWRKYK